MLEWTKEGILYEGDQRHVEICLSEAGIEENSRIVNTPVDRSNKDAKNSNNLKAGEREDEKLDSSGTTRYRGLVARMNYLGQDRSDIQFAVKELGKDLASPSQESWMKLKRLLRYLKGSPRLRLKYSYQHNDRTITAWTDSDFAGCIKSRKSTSAGVIMLGNHLVKSWSTNQTVIALSSGEAEYYSMVKAGSVALGIESLMKDLGVEDTGSIAIKTDASAAVGIGSRIGIGKVRHIEVNQLWLQESGIRPIQDNQSSDERESG